MLYTIPLKNWPEELAMAIASAHDNDTIIVQSETQQDIALRGAERRKIRIVVIVKQSKGVNNGK